MKDLLMKVRRNNRIVLESKKGWRSDGEVRLMNMFLNSVISAAILIVNSTAVFADGGTGAATRYEVTMLKLELCTDAPPHNRIWIQLAQAQSWWETGNKVFDIASVNVGRFGWAIYFRQQGLPVGTTFKYAKADIFHANLR